MKSNIKAGDYVTFGTYPPTASGTDKTPIEWLVLDVQGNSALLISKYGLDAKPYNTSFIGVTWEKCTLRTWLNNDFMAKAFNANEQQAVLTTTVDNSKSQSYSGWTSVGNNILDRVFLLSYGEANKYFDLEFKIDNIKSRVEPTAYAKQQGSYTNGKYKTADGKAASRWWLRTSGIDDIRAAFVEYGGSLANNYVTSVNYAVRPALWINLSAVVFRQ